MKFQKPQCRSWVSIVRVPRKNWVAWGLDDHWKVAFSTPKELASSFKPVVPRNLLEALELNVEKIYEGTFKEADAELM